MQNIYCCLLPETWGWEEKGIWKEEHRGRAWHFYSNHFVNKWWMGPIGYCCFQEASWSSINQALSAIQYNQVSGIRYSYLNWNLCGARLHSRWSNPQSCASEEPDLYSTIQPTTWLVDRTVLWTSSQTRPGCSIDLAWLIISYYIPWEMLLATTLCFHVNVCNEWCTVRIKKIVVLCNFMGSCMRLWGHENPMTMW